MMRSLCLLLIGVGFWAAQASAAEALPPLRGLSRTDLLEMRAAGDGRTRATSAQAWREGRGAEALAGFVSLTGPLPDASKRGELTPEILEEVDCGTYVRRLVTYAAEPGGRVPAYLCVPKAALAGAAVPAVLCLHPTENQIGHQVVVGLGGKPNRQYAVELAERGFVTLSPSYPLLAKYQPDLQALGYQSGTMKAVWDNVRGLDYLETLPFVDHRAGFAAIGHSLGGHNAVYTAVFEPRLRVVVSSCGLDSYLDYKDGNLAGWNQERYLPGMAAYLGRPEAVPYDFDELLALLAPRRVFLSAPLHDSNFKHASVDRIAAAARQVFALHGAAERLEVMHPDCDHDFPDAARERAYAIIAEELWPSRR